MVPPRRPARRRAGARRPRPDGARRTRHGQESATGPRLAGGGRRQGRAGRRPTTSPSCSSRPTRRPMSPAPRRCCASPRRRSSPTPSTPSACCHLRGHGVPRDSAAAARWLRKAADNGNPAGEVEYAILLFNGEGVAADEGVAARYFRRAAGQGQRHRPEPPRPPLRRRPRPAAEPRRGGGVASSRRRARPHRCMARFHAAHLVGRRPHEGGTPRGRARRADVSG